LITTGGAQCSKAETTSMSAPFSLTANPLRCEIVPSLGGCIAGLWRGDVAVLRSPGAGGLQAARQSGSYPLVPFSNRIAHATLAWEGTNHPLIKNFGTEPHAIHGVGWTRPWDLIEADERFALLSYQHKPDGAWPFAFDSTQAFRLSDNALEMTLSITNQSTQATPVGLGWHPYFLKRANSRISFQATGRWEMDALKLPTHRSRTDGVVADCATLDVDHCFDGWSGALHLQDDLLHARITSNMTRLVVFTNAAQECIAIEPVSHVNNAINLLAQGVASAEALGVQVLQPGESMTREMTVHVGSAC
jgi:aldose 1-epimerase